MLGLLEQWRLVVEYPQAQLLLFLGALFFGFIQLISTIYFLTILKKNANTLNEKKNILSNSIIYGNYFMSLIHAILIGPISLFIYFNGNYNKDSFNIFIYQSIILISNGYLIADIIIIAIFKKLRVHQKNGVNGTI